MGSPVTTEVSLGCWSPGWSLNIQCDWPERYEQAVQCILTGYTVPPVFFGGVSSRWRNLSLFHGEEGVTGRQTATGTLRPDQRKSFFRDGGSTRGEGTVFTKNVPSPLVHLLLSWKNRESQAARQRRGPSGQTRGKVFSGMGRAREGKGSVYKKRPFPLVHLFLSWKRRESQAVRQRRGPSGQTRRKVFSGMGRAREGKGQFLQKTPLPLSQKSQKDLPLTATGGGSWRPRGRRWRRR